MSERYGLTKNGKVRTRPLRTVATAAMPPAMLKEEEPGYIYYERAGIWVYLEDFHVVIEVARETANRDITSRHGTRATKNRGCKGPLCRKALRDDLYGGAKSLRYQRLEELLDTLQGVHNDEWVASLTPEERERLSAHAERLYATIGRKIELVKAS